jgi:hypothetical protein
VIYLDTGCLVKLYYPEPNSASVAAIVQGKRLCYTPTIGCRSLDILHCAAAKIVGATDFVSTDVRQKALATAIGLKLIIV